MTAFKGLYNLTPLPNTFRSLGGLSDVFDLNPLPGIESALGILPSTATGTPNINNSGNKTTTIIVNSPKEAADTVNNIDEPGTLSGDIGGNIAESTGAR